VCTEWVSSDEQSVVYSGRARLLGERIWMWRRRRDDGYTRRNRRSWRRGGFCRVRYRHRRHGRNGAGPVRDVDVHGAGHSRGHPNPHHGLTPVLCEPCDEHVRIAKQRRLHDGPGAGACVSGTDAARHDVDAVLRHCDEHVWC
jgi:hypothetical protein